MPSTKHELVVKSTGDRIRNHLARLWRSTPAFGLGAHLGYREDRLKQARLDDAGYLEVMAQLETEPAFPRLSEERERHVLAGELVGFLLATCGGITFSCVTRGLLASWLLTWAVAFLADWAGGRIGGWVCDRKHPDQDEDAVESTKG
jgi:hypothetical protein